MSSAAPLPAITLVFKRVIHASSDHAFGLIACFIAATLNLGSSVACRAAGITPSAITLYPQAFPRKVNDCTTSCATANVVSHTSSTAWGG